MKRRVTNRYLSWIVKRVDRNIAQTRTLTRRLWEHKVCFGEYMRRGKGTEGPGALSANEMDVLDVRVSRDHSINAAASWQWLTHPGTQRDMTCASGRAPSTGHPIVTYLCTRQTLLIFLSFIAFVIIRSFTVPAIFLPLPSLPRAFLSSLIGLLSVSRIKCDVRRDNVAFISSHRIPVPFYIKTA